MLAMNIPMLLTGIQLAVSGTADDFGGLVDGVTSENKIDSYESNKKKKENTTTNKATTLTKTTNKNSTKNKINK